MLQTGALPVEFETVERTDVSATLGAGLAARGAQRRDRRAVLVAIFLLAVYRFLGLVAVLGLAVYAAFMYGAILLLGVTLTLPGFAGLILTIGVAADANVVIFERIKEEARAGQLRARGDRGRLREGLAHDPRRERGHVHHRARAVRGRDGEREGLRADAADRHGRLARDRRRGDARACSACSPGFKWFDNPRFMGATAQEFPPWQRWDVVGRRRLLVRPLAGGDRGERRRAAVQGLNLGIDFKGGEGVGEARPVVADRDRDPLRPRFGRDARHAPRPWRAALSTRMLMAWRRAAGGPWTGGRDSASTISGRPRAASRPCHSPSTSRSTSVGLVTPDECGRRASARSSVIVSSNRSMSPSTSRSTSAGSSWGNSSSVSIAARSPARGVRSWVGRIGAERPLPADQLVEVVRGRRERPIGVIDLRDRAAGQVDLEVAFAELDGGVAEPPDRPGEAAGDEEGHRGEQYDE